eukprot:1172115-Rhodomonas_salina.4
MDTLHHNTTNDAEFTKKLRRHDSSQVRSAVCGSWMRCTALTPRTRLPELQAAEEELSEEASGGHCWDRDKRNCHLSAGSLACALCSACRVLRSARGRSIRASRALAALTAQSAL